nr:MAG TPA: hypothetical protein [Caudoviricetes sp.]
MYMKAIIINIVLIIGVISSFILGEVLPIVLPRLSRHFNRKPFNCRPCFTFHLTWISIAVLSLVVQSLDLFISGLISAFIIFLIVRYIDSKKVVK